MHYIVTRDDVYDESKKQLQKNSITRQDVYLENYQRVIKVS